MPSNFEGTSDLSSGHGDNSILDSGLLAVKCLFFPLSFFSFFNQSLAFQAFFKVYRFNLGLSMESHPILHKR